MTSTSNAVPTSVESETQVVISPPPERMVAALHFEYGGPETAQIQEVPVPLPGPKEILVRVRQVSLNASDWEGLTGSPAYVRIFGWTKPAYPILGSDIVGTVVRVGNQVTRFQVGDAVMADTMGRWGGLAEYAAIPESMVVLKPQGVSEEQAAALPQAAAIAWKGIADQGLTSGQRVLINGAGGGSGTLAIQLAKRAGAHVTGVDNAKKLALMTHLGADVVIDYQTVDILERGERFDLILDLVATRSVAQNATLLNPGGRYLLVGGTMKSLLQTAFIGPFWGLFSGKKLRVLSVPTHLEAALRVAELHQAGQIEICIERTFPLREIQEALRHHGEGNALGKVLVAP